jgi:hypothetical protein
MTKTDQGNVFLKIDTLLVKNNAVPILFILHDFFLSLSLYGLYNCAGVSYLLYPNFLGIKGFLVR